MAIAALEDGSDRSVDARSIVTLIVFFVVNALVIWPVRIPLPLSLSRWTSSIHSKIAFGPSSGDEKEPQRDGVIDAGSGPTSSLSLSSSSSSASASSERDVTSPLGRGVPVKNHVREEAAERTDFPIPMKPINTPSPSTGSAFSKALNDHRRDRLHSQDPLDQAKKKEKEKVVPDLRPPPSPASAPFSATTQGDERSISEGKSQAERLCFPLDLRTAPVIGVLLLLASTCIPGSVVRRGIVGSGGVRPYDIMTLFLSFAYISLSLDATGVLRYLAFLVASRSTSHGGGQTLYNAFYIFFSSVGLLFGNDPLILSGTPFLAYFTDHASISPPTAYLFTHFQVANLVSALLVSSNPTNLVLTSAFGISFLSYSAWMALPSVGAVIILYPLLRYGVFRKRGMIPSTIYPPKMDPRQALIDPTGAIFGAALFVLVIAVLITLSALDLLTGTEGVWTVTAPAAVVVLIRDMWADRRRQRQRRQRKQHVANQSAAGTQIDGQEREKPADSPPDDLRPANASDPASSSPHPNAITTTDIPQPRTPLHSSTDTTQTQTLSQQSTQPSPPSSSPSSSPSPTASAQRAQRSHAFRPLSSFTSSFPITSLVISRLPLPLLPFAFSFFILVEGLQHTGWIRVFGGWWTAWEKAGGVAGSVGLMGILSVVGCNFFGTNIGATILLSRVLQQWATTHDYSDRSLYGAVFALAVGSNFGAYSLVFSASLAGLLWRTILAQKHLHISRKEFVTWNTLPLVVTMVVGCLVVAGEVCVIYQS